MGDGIEGFNAVLKRALPKLQPVMSREHACTILILAADRIQTGNCLLEYWQRHAPKQARLHLVFFEESGGGAQEPVVADATGTIPAVATATMTADSAAIARTATSATGAAVASATRFAAESVTASATIADTSPDTSSHVSSASQTDPAATSTHLLKRLLSVVDDAGVPLLPGVHRFEAPGVTVTRLIGPVLRTFAQLVATLDIVVVESEQPLASIPHYGDMLLRRAAPQLMMLAPDQVIDVMLTAVRKKGARRLDRGEAGGGWMVMDAKLHRPLKPPAPASRTAWVIGGSLAGAGVAYALALRGWRVHVTDPSLAAGAPGPQAGHLAAAMTPLISADDNFKARLSRAGVYRAHQRWSGFGPQIILSRNGTLELARTSGHARDLLQAVRTMAYPQGWVRLVDTGQADQQSGVAVTRQGAYFAKGMTVSPPNLINALLTHPNIHCHGHRIAALRKGERGWQLFSHSAEFKGRHLRATQPDACLPDKAPADLTIPADAKRDAEEPEIASSGSPLGDIEPGARMLAECDVVILAAAEQTPQLLANSGLDQRTRRSGRKEPTMPAVMAMDTLGGQVMHVPAVMLGQVPETVIGAEGYFLPPVHGHCVLGSTYEPGQKSPICSLAGQKTIVSKLAAALAPNVLKSVSDTLASADPAGSPQRDVHLPGEQVSESARAGTGSEAQAVFSGWSGSRAVIRGRLPAFGPVPDKPGLWLACGYASHGLTWSALAGDVIAAMLNAEPVPLEYDLLQAVAPR